MTARTYLQECEAEVSIGTALMLAYRLSSGFVRVTASKYRPGPVWTVSLHVGGEMVTAESDDLYTAVAEAIREIAPPHMDDLKRKEFAPIPRAVFTVRRDGGIIPGGSDVRADA